MDLTIKVEIGVTPELKALAESLIGARKAMPEGECERVQQKAKAVKEEPKPQPQPEPIGNYKDAPDAPDAEQPQPQPQSQPQPQPQKATYTEEDIREAMHKCRCRIEGEDYKDNPQGEGYTKWHKNLTAFFKNMSARLGYDRPSELPVELRKAFIDECADIIIGEDGLLRSMPF